jgi:F0F1-type ATP synthase assembly protein I
LKDLWRVGPLLQLSWVIALSTLLPLGAGILIDRTFHTAPLFILIGGLIGILAGTVGAVRITTRAIESLSPPQEHDDSDDLTNDTGKEDRL